VNRRTDSRSAERARIRNQRDEMRMSGAARAKGLEEKNLSMMR